MEKMNEIKTFTFFREYIDLISLLTETEQKDLIYKIVNYIFYDKSVEGLSENQQKVWINLKRPLDKSKNQSINVTKRYTKQPTKPDTKQDTKCSTKRGTHNMSMSNVNSNMLIEDNKRVLGREEETIFDFIEKSFGRTLSQAEYEVISSWEDNELTRYAVKQAELARAFSVKYISKILFSYKKAGISTVAEAEERERIFQESKTTVNPSLEQTIKLKEWNNIKAEEVSPEEQEELQKLLNNY